jgi:hypothetical protein
MARRPLACLGVLFVAGAACSVAAASDRSSDVRASAAATAAKRVRFSDATREDPQAPDITAAVVSNSDAVRAPASTITFRIEIRNRPTLTEDMRLAVWIDADDDRATGLAEHAALPGADYLVRWDRKLREGASLLRCGESTCRNVPAPTFRFSYGRGATFRMQAAELGNTRRFRFSARAYSGIVGSLAHRSRLQRHARRLRSGGRRVVGLSPRRP